MMNLISKAKETKGKIQFVQAYFKLAANPNDTVLVFKLQERLFNSISPRARAEALEFISQTPAIKQALDEQYLAPSYKVEDLANCEPGTLGYAYYRHMHDNGFTPDFFPQVPQIDKLAYFELRMRQTHDIWHVLTGFGPSIEDEVGLQSFYAAQMPGPAFNAILVSAGLMHGVMHNMPLIKPIVNSISKGWQQGQAAKHIQAAKWEEMWNKSLDEIRQEYNIVPVSNRYDFAPEKVLQASI